MDPRAEPRGLGNRRLLIGLTCLSIVMAIALGFEVVGIFKADVAAYCANMTAQNQTCNISLLAAH